MEGVESFEKRKRSGSGSDEEPTGKRAAGTEDRSEDILKEPTLRDIYLEILSLKSDFQKVEKRLEDKINSVEKRTEELEIKVDKQDKRLLELESGFEAGLSGAPCSSDEIEKLKEELEKQQTYTRRFNLVVRGIPRKANETNSDIQSHFENYCLYKLGVSSLNIDKIHRLPDPNLVLVRFVCLKDRDRVWSARRTCKDLFIQQDLPKTARERANLLFRCRTAAERSKLYKSVRIAGGRLVLDEMAYRPEDLESLPPSIRPSTLATNSDDSTLVFFTRFSHFSNHRITPFSYKGERYNCMEKFITVARARLAKNREMEERAWKTHYPPELKGLLHIMSKDGLESRWETEVEETVLPALIEKFRQHPQLLKALLDTGKKTLGEASASELWGTGVGLGQKDTLNIQKWTGRNFLGKMLARVRAHFCTD